MDIRTSVDAHTPPNRVAVRRHATNLHICTSILCAVRKPTLAALGIFAASKDGGDGYRSQPKHAKPEVSVMVQRLCQKRHRDESFREALRPIAGSALLRQQIEFAGSNVMRKSIVKPSSFDRIQLKLMSGRQMPCQLMAQP